MIQSVSHILGFWAKKTYSFVHIKREDYVEYHNHRDGSISVRFNFPVIKSIEVVGGEKELEEQEVVTCCVCGGDCEMNTEYEGSAVCKDKDCSVHKEV